jgi:uncharacterized damage-inducible protein DinB
MSSTTDRVSWSPESVANTVGKQFLSYSVWQLRDYNLPKIREAVELLSDLELWHRDGPTSNSIGNLLAHLAGNIRQHIIGGVGGGSQIRDRDGEFAATGGASGADLLQRLSTTIDEACTVLETFNPEQLLERRTIQGKQAILLDDIFHVVEHFSYHTGQIVAIVKARKSHRFPWYEKLETKIK